MIVQQPKEWRSVWCRGDTVARARVSRGLSLQEVADRAGVHRTAVERMEANEHVFVDTVAQVAIVLGLSLEEVERCTRSPA